MSTFLQTALKYRRIPADIQPGQVRHQVEEEEEGEEEEEDDDDHDDEVFGVCDPHCRLELEDIRLVEGRVDEAGWPLGRCLVQLSSGDEVCGVWRGGRREGLGSVTGPGL